LKNLCFFTFNFYIPFQPVEEINEKNVEKIQKADALEEFEKLKYLISSKMKEPLDPTFMVREMRTKNYLI